MAKVARKYLPGYTGTCTLDAVEYPIQGWSSDADPGLWDATSELELGWMYQEAGMQKVSFSFTMLCKVTSGLPPFVAGDTIPAVFKINGTTAYAGNIIITKLSTKNDLKGGITFDMSADSQGPLTGSLAPSVTAISSGS